MNCTYLAIIIKSCIQGLEFRHLVVWNRLLPQLACSRFSLGWYLEAWVVSACTADGQVGVLYEGVFEHLEQLLLQI